MKVTKNLPVQWKFQSTVEAKRFRFALLNAMNAIRKYQVAEFLEVQGTVKVEGHAVVYTPGGRFSMIETHQDTSITSLQELIRLYIQAPPKDREIEFLKLDYITVDQELLQEWLALKNFRIIKTEPFTLSTP